MNKLRLNKKRGIVSILILILLVVALGFFVFKAVNVKALDKTIDNMDDASQWSTSDQTNLAKSQETTIKTEGTGSIKVIANSGATDDVYYFLKTKAAGNHTIATRYASIDLEMEVKSGNQTISTDTSWGNATPDTRMLGVRVEGDLTIDAGKTLTAATRKKGMVIYVDGDLTVNGTISMTARGAKAAGQHVLLLDDGAEYDIPAAGANGGAGGGPLYSSGQDPGNAGSNGAGAQTGGGGGGGAAAYLGDNVSGGTGCVGTSYSGGSGSGGGSAGSQPGALVGYSCAANGGAGGGGNNAFDNACAGGGAGNPGGAGHSGGYAGENGTGGLLVVFVAGNISINSGGIIEAKGRNGGGTGSCSLAKAGGGGSGGGHISIFHKGSYTNNGNLNVSGGQGGAASGATKNGPGGNGGNGTTRIQQSDISFALNDVLSRDLGAGNEKDLSDVTQIKFDIRSSRTGTYMQFGWGESAWTDHTSNITINSADTWETKTIDISGIANANKDAVRYLGFKVTNADSSFTGYIDNIVWANKVDGGTCTEDSDCIHYCDTDWNSTTKYCHPTESSCIDDTTEYANGYELCSGNSWYKSCSNGVWGAQQNCDTTNDYCDAGGGAQSGYDLAETCNSGPNGGCQPTSCTSCEPYMAASTSSCKSSCSSDSDCWPAYHCDASSCVGDLANGNSCDEDSDCTSNHCVDGYCCDTACTGTCQRCDATPGTCTTRAANDNTEVTTTCYYCDGVNTTSQPYTGDNGVNCNTDCTKCLAGSCDTRPADENTECSACNRCDGTNPTCQAQTGETGYLCTNDCYDCIAGTCTAMTEDDDGSCNSGCDSCVAGVCTIRADGDNTECPSCYRCNGIDNICHYFCGGRRSTPTPIFFISGCENIPETGGEVKETFKSGQIAKAIFPPNAIEGTMAVGIEPQDKTEVIKNNPLPKNTQIVGDLVAEFKAFSAISGAIKELESFKEEISITFSYTDEQLKEANLDENSLGIYWWDETNNNWQPLETKVDTILNQVTANIPHFTLFALMGQESEKEELKEEKEEEPIAKITIEELKAKIKSIAAQIIALKAKINKINQLLRKQEIKKEKKEIKKQIEGIPADYKFSKYLWYGQKDEEVRYLQIFLKSQGPEIYPEGLVTGYFKSLTEKALKRFQIKYGIIASEKADGAGFCGPKTRAKINEILGR